MSCRHREVPITFPDGTQVVASSHLVREAGEPAPEFGLYLYDGWRPWWPARKLPWPDYGLPLDDDVVRQALDEVWSRAQAGQRVEVACHGGHGRTGSVLACLAIRAGVPPGQAVQWVRDHYCPEAVDTDEQAVWVERFADT